MNSHTNPRYAKAVASNPLADTPLFESARQPFPPRTIAPSLNRLDSFRKLVESGQIERSQQQVLAIIESSGPITMHAIGHILGKQVNLISGRITELRKMGYIEKSGSIVNPETGRGNTLWKATA